MGLGDRLRKEFQHWPSYVYLIHLTTLLSILFYNTCGSADLIVEVAW